MKKVLILSPSPRCGGNSGTFCDEFLHGAIKAGNNAEKIFPRDETIHYCTGCSMCSLYGKPCLQKDDATEVVGEMLAADVVVMSMPVYFYTMLAQTRILIDRCYSQYTGMTDKEFYFIVTATEDDRKKTLRTIDASQGFFDCLKNSTVKRVMYELGTWYTGKTKGDPVMQEVYEIGKGI